MRKTVRLVIILLIVAIIYFGYSAWIEAVAIYNVNAVQVGATSSWNTQMQEMWIKISPDDRKTLFWDNQEWIKYVVDKSKDKISDIFSMEGLSNISFIKAIIAEANKNSDTPYVLHGFMGANSLLKTLLDPFKLILVGGVFAMFIPLTKQLFFGTLIGMKSYIKNRQSNLLYNYKKTINYVEDLKKKLEVGDLDVVKDSYATFSGLAFKPEFLKHMMDEICTVLIKERDLTVFVEPAQTVIDSLKEMYNKERGRAITGRGDELFFDLKRSYEYCSKGSKYAIEYFKAQQSKTDNSLGWKIYSLEIFKFNIYLLISFIPSFLILMALGITEGLFLPSEVSSDIRTLILAISFFVPWVLLTIALHAFLVFRNKEYKSLRKVMIKPAVIYYSLYFLTFVTISAGVVGMVKVGNIAAPNSASIIWTWFSALAYLVLSTCLIFYVIATLIDSFKTYKTMKRKYIIDGIVVPGGAWLISTVANFVALYAFNENTTDLFKMNNIFATVNTIILIGTWIYLLISSFLLNNLIMPKTSRQLRESLEAEVLLMKQRRKKRKATTKLKAKKIVQPQKEQDSFDDSIE